MIDTAAMVLAYFKVLVWPCVVLALALIFRGQLTGAIKRISSGSIRAAGVELAVELGKARDSVQASDGAKPEATVRLDDTVDRNEVEAAVRRMLDDVRLAEYESRERGWGNDVIATFVSFTRFITDLEDKEFITPAPGYVGRYTAVVAALRSNGIVDPKLLDAIKRLERVYYAQVEGFRVGQPSQVDESFARLYFDTVQDVATRVATNVVAWRALRSEKDEA